MKVLKIVAVVGLILLAVLVIGGLVLYRFLQEPEKTPSQEQIEREKGVAVEVTRPSRRDVTDYLLCDATVEAKIRWLLRAQIAETIEAVHVDVGDSVELGQLLIEFRKTDLQADVEARRAAHEEARNNFESYERLFKEKVVSRVALEARRTAMQAAAAALQRAESSMRFTQVRAPIGEPPGEGEGRVIVQARHVEPGERKGAKDELLTLVDLSEVEVHALVPETGLPVCGPGTGAEFRLEGEQTWRAGTVRRVSPSTGNASRFFDVFIEASNERRAGQWVMRAGMYAEVRFASARASDALVVRADALRREGARHYVFLVARGLEENPESPAEQRSRTSEFRTKLRRLLGMERSKEPDESKQAPKEVWKARRVEVQTGLRGEGYVQLLGDAVSEDVLLVANPRGQMRDGVKVNIVKGLAAERTEETR